MAPEDADAVTIPTLCYAPKVSTLRRLQYEQTKRETIQQMKEFEVSLNKMASGNMTLVDQLSSVRLVREARAMRYPEGFDP